MDNKLKIHQKDLQFQAIKIYKFKNELNPSFMSKTYKEKNIQYSLRRRILLIPNANTKKYGINLLNFRGSVLWNNLPIKFKKFKSLQEFKLLLKQIRNLPWFCSAFKHKEFWLPIALLLILTFMFYFIQCMYVNISNLLVSFY